MARTASAEDVPLTTVSSELSRYVIGEPSRKFLWVLSRTPQMKDDLYAEITGRLAAKGYDASKLERMKLSQ